MASHIEQSIREAFAQGWGQNKPPYEHTFISANMYWSRWLDANGTEYTLPVSQHFLDPLFWQALGKARVWSDFTEEHYTDRRDRTYSRTHQTWKHNWHRFIDHLTEGKIAESFFETKEFYERAKENE